MTPEGQKRADRIAADRNDTNLGHPHANSYEDRPLAERCILGFNSGPPMTPGAYNNNVELFQTPGYVAIVNEMIHDTRIVPLDGRPHGKVPLWRGDCRGHWEGDTLVVNTINFKRETSSRTPARTCTWSRNSPASTPTRSCTNSPSMIRPCGHGRSPLSFR